ncbi:hypothetical protein [Candidatus Nitrososphaera sp. FF02]|uniref:hypothetical protein n=1 Tax=Candidatus Nitrososphaera sp. FF02 TaxID=3398226 RepID=UPI0039E9DCB8
MASELALDASAFYAGTAFLAGAKCMTTSAVFEEVRHIKKSHAALEALVYAGNLAIKEPDEKSVDAVTAAQKRPATLQNFLKQTFPYWRSRWNTARRLHRTIMPWQTSQPC